MKNIIIYGDPDHGLMVRQGDCYRPCRSKTDVINAVGDILDEHEKTSCKPIIIPETD